MPRNTAGKLNFARSMSARPHPRPQGESLLVQLARQRRFQSWRTAHGKSASDTEYKICADVLKASERASELEPKLHRALLS